MNENKFLMSPEYRENPECGGSGKIKHPALIYLENEEATDADI